MSEDVKKVTWDLTEFYKDINDPKIDEDIKKVDSLIDSFVKKYKGKINSPDLSPSFLLDAIREKEEISYLSANYSLYAALLFSKNVTGENITIFYQKINEISNRQGTKLTWFGVEWLHLDDEVAKKIIENDLLADYRHSLKQSRLMKKHTLSEEEEVLLSKTSLTGSSAFVKLFDLVDTSTKYELEVDGEIKTLSFSELSNYISYDPDRNLREKASNSLTEGLKKNERIYSFILNTLLLDSKIDDEIRSFSYPQEATFLSDELNKEIVDVMVNAVKDSYGEVEKFYTLKKDLLGYEKLHEWDRYNAFFSDIEITYSWKESKDIILDAFNTFNKEFGAVAEMFFERGWIDAPITDGKRSGAFCMMGTPKHHPFVFMNFKGKASDVMTLAHELGHAIHSYLSKDQVLSEFYPVTPLAEIASVFAEMLVFNRMYQKLTDEKQKVNILGGKIQEIFATVYRQNAFYLFESDIHTYRRDKGELSLAQINTTYQKRLQEMFGKGLKLTNQHENWWMYVSHFYHYDFYVYSYVFGELLTLALYQISLEQDDFSEKYIKLLKLGGSKTPEELLGMFDLDITDVKFWDRGTKYIGKLVEDFELLTNQLK